MKIRKKLLVWGTFIAMAFIIAGCEEEEGHFDSVVEVEESSSEGLGDGSGDSSASNIHLAKDSIGDAVSGLFFAGDKEAEQNEPEEEIATESSEAVEAEHREPAATQIERSSSETNETDKNSEELPNTSIRDNSADTEKKEDELKPSEHIEAAPLEKEQKEEQISTVPEEEAIEETQHIVEDEKSEDIDITVLLINEANIRLGMVAVMDPHTKEQVLIGALGNGEMLIFDMKWPTKEKHLKVGCYDEAGNLIKEESIDMAHITKMGIITFEGEGSITQTHSEIQ